MQSRNCRTSTNEIDVIVDWSKQARIYGLNSAYPFLGCIWKLSTHPDSGSFCGVPRHFSLKYVSIPAKKCLAQRKNPSLPVTSWVFRYTLGELVLCECKNCENSIGVTYIGKFASLLSATSTSTAFGLQNILYWYSIKNFHSWNGSF